MEDCPRDDEEIIEFEIEKYPFPVEEGKDEFNEDPENSRENDG